MKSKPKARGRGRHGSREKAGKGATKEPASLPAVFYPRTADPKPHPQVGSGSVVTYPR
jgi:hypothetical protein